LSAGQQLAAAPDDRLSFRMLQLNCYACHERGQRGGVGPQRQRYFETAGHADLGDEGRLPPPLDGVGRKLKVAWLKKVFEGTGDVRPHMLARMPKFAIAAVTALPAAFAEVDRPGKRTAKDVFPTASRLAKAGRSLLDIGCVQCHPLRGERLPGVLGVDLAGITERVYPQWFHDFMYNPAQLKPRTRMPTFFPNGRSTVPNILGGDVDQQIAAMWAYLKDIEHQPLPEKIVQGRVHNFELVPKENPIVLRTFMKEAGTQAIAVGFPQKVHFAFDAEQVRLVQAWRGRFLDAHGTWFDRFVPPAVPLGKYLMSFPSGIPLAAIADATASWPARGGEEAGYQFRGYRFDRARVPTFLYRFGEFDVEDRIEPRAGQQLARRLHISVRDRAVAGKQLWFRANVGKTLKQHGDTAYSNDHGLTVMLLKDLAQAGRLRKQNGLAEWLIPLQTDSEITIQVNYKW